jgi:hypothetical protein
VRKKGTWCITCGGEIGPSQGKEEVKARKGRLVRYKHADYRDCRAHLADGPSLHRDRGNPPRRRRTLGEIEEKPDKNWF